MASICNDERASSGVASGHDRKTLKLSGPVCNPDGAGGHGCIAGKQALEAPLTGTATTAIMPFGDTAHIEMTGRDGLSVFGAIDQRVTGPGCPAEPGGADADAA